MRPRQVAWRGSPPRLSSSQAPCSPFLFSTLPLLSASSRGWPRSAGRGAPPGSICVGGVARRWRSEEQGQRQRAGGRAPLHARSPLPPSGRQLPLRMREGLHSATGEVDCLHVGFVLSPHCRKTICRCGSTPLPETVSEGVPLVE
jgi:hypothetical protein